MKDVADGLKAVGMDRPYASSFAGCLIIFYAICGFLLVYLWAKIYLKAQLVLNDRDIFSITTNITAQVRADVTSQVKTIDNKADIYRVEQRIEQFTRERTRITVEEEKSEEIKQVLQRANPGMVTVLDDPQKGRWGGQSAANGLVFEASFEPSDKDISEAFYYVTLSVRSTNAEKPLTGEVYFFLHDSYNLKMIQHITAANNLASIRVGSYEAFTVGSYAMDSNTKLELDLNEVPGAPVGYTYPDKLFTIDQLRQESDRLKAEV